MVLVVLFSEDEIMAYFLKKTKLKNRTYLAIYESFYSHEKRGLRTNATSRWAQ